MPRGRPKKKVNEVPTPQVPPPTDGSGSSAGLTARPITIYDSPRVPHRLIREIRIRYYTDGSIERSDDQFNPNTNSY